MRTLWQDLRYGSRMLVQRPGFTLTAAIVLARGSAPIRPCSVWCTGPVQSAAFQRFQPPRSGTDRLAFHQHEDDLFRTGLSRLGRAQSGHGGTVCLCSVPGESHRGRRALGRAGLSRFHEFLRRAAAGGNDAGTRIPSGRRARGQPQRDCAKPQSLARPFPCGPEYPRPDRHPGRCGLHDRRRDEAHIGFSGGVDSFLRPPDAGGIDRQRPRQPLSPRAGASQARGLSGPGARPR